jgi:4-phosphopantoate--beta-alanine ligase
LHGYGVANVLTGFDFIKLAHIASNRANVDKNGTFKADVVFVPLEDGDRAQALTKFGKTVLTVDLNPLSRTAVASTVTIVDEVTRALKNLVSFAKHFKSESHQDELNLLKATFDNPRNLKASYVIMQKQLKSLAR